MRDADAVRFMLRAEIRCSGQTVISSGLELTEQTVFVVTEWRPPRETPVSVRLSFPTVVEPVELGARVVENRAPGAPGELGGVVLAFDDGSCKAAAALARQVRGLCANANERPAEAAACRVLLVDDSRLIRDMFAFGMARSLQPPGAVVIDHAEDAERAWSKLREHRYDLVIVDYFLPAGEDGASLIARLRQDERLSRVPIVAISVGGRAARDATLSAGADLFLDKPLVLRDLLETMRILARRGGAAARERPTVLVLDDSPLILALTRFALEAAGFQVAVAEDLATFERLRAQSSPDLFVIDVQMPEAFGDDVASTLRGLHGVRAPILLVSSLEEPELARRARAANATGYVRKEAGMSALVERCRELLGSAA